MVEKSKKLGFGPIHPKLMKLKKDNLSKKLSLKKIGKIAEINDQIVARNGDSEIKKVKKKKGMKSNSNTAIDKKEVINQGSNFSEPEISQKTTNKNEKRKEMELDNETVVLNDNIEQISQDEISQKTRKKNKKRKQMELVNETGVLTDHVDEISQKSRKKNKKRQQKKLDNETGASTDNVEEIAQDGTEKKIKKAKKQKKRKLLANDILDSDESEDEMDEELPPKKKRKTEKSEVQKQVEDPELKARTVFVGNVPLKCSKKSIQKQFRKYGIIDSIRIRGVPVANPKLPKKVAVIKQEFHPGRNNVLCYIRYNDKEDAVKAEAANGMLFEGHHLRVHCCGSTAKPDETKAIFIGNLSFDATEDELWKLFDVCGPISHVRIIRDPYTGMGKGFAFVNFVESDGVQLALEMEDVKLKDRVLRISLCNSNVAKKNKKMNKVKEITQPGQPRFRRPFGAKKQSTDEGTENNNFSHNKKKGGFNPVGKKSFQGSKFTDKKKKFKKNKGFSEKQTKIVQIAPKSE